MAKFKMAKKVWALSLALLATSIGVFAQNGLFQRGVNAMMECDGNPANEKNEKK